MSLLSRFTKIFGHQLFGKRITEDRRLAALEVATLQAYGVASENAPLQAGTAEQFPAMDAIPVFPNDEIMGFSDDEWDE